MLSLDPQLFLSVFALIFLAEIPDKTAVATLVLATRRNPFAIFIGVAAAFVIQSVVAVAFGSAFRYFPRGDVRLAAGGLFLIFAFAMWFRKEEGEEEKKALKEEGASFRKTIISAFVIIFLAEWGDLTQLATVALEAKYQKPLTILVAAILALWCVTALAVLAGNRLRRVINPALLQKIAAVAFAIVGLIILLRA